jgi:type VII secretion protein EccE
VTHTAVGGQRAAQSTSDHRLVSSVAVLPQRVLPLRDVLIIQVLAVGGLAIAVVAGATGWYGAVIGLVVSSALVLRIGGTTLPAWLVARTGFARSRRRRHRERAVAEPFDVDLGDGEQIGFRWDGSTLMSVVRIDANPQAMTVMEPGVTVSGETVPVQLLADCLRQFDISLSSIDVISQGSRSQGHGHVAAIYDAVIGPLPAIAERTVWVVIRFDPAACPEGVRNRGGGRDGIVRAATSATRRVVNRLTGVGLRPQIMTASQIAQASHQLCDGVNPHTVGETWQVCREGGFQLRSFEVLPEMMTTAGLGTLWTIPSYSTTVCISLRRDADAEGRDDDVAARGLVRFDSHGRTPVRLRGLADLNGRQHAALLASLPMPQPSSLVGRWAHGRGERPLESLAVPASGCGQVVGADERGRAVALPLFGSGIRRVEMSGTLHLAQQAVLRSLALGARVRVHTRRPAAWSEMVRAVGEPNVLWVTESGRGTMRAGAERNHTVEMFDGVAEQPVRVGVTSMLVKPPGSAMSADADVTLELVDLDRDLVKIGTAGGSAMVAMVATDDEMRYLRASFGSRN